MLLQLNRVHGFASELNPPFNVYLTFILRQLVTRVCNCYFSEFIVRTYTSTYCSQNAAKHTCIYRFCPPPAFLATINLAVLMYINTQVPTLINM